MSEQQSPVLRFGLPAIAVMIAFGLWSSLLGPVASEMHMKADRIESDAKRLSDGADLAVRLGRADRKDRNATGDLIVAFGEVAAPPNENEAGSSLLALINDIREEFGNAIRPPGLRLKSVHHLGPLHPPLLHLLHALLVRLVGVSRPHVAHLSLRDHSDEVKQAFIQLESTDLAKA